MTSLTSLSLKNNKLTTMSRDFCKLKKNYNIEVTLDLSQNKLTCSCDLSIMLSVYGKVNAIGTCSTKENTTEQLSNFAKGYKDLILKSKCDVCDYKPCGYRGICLSDKYQGYKCHCLIGYKEKTCSIT